MKVEKNEQSIILSQSEEYTLWAHDVGGRFSTRRTIIFCSKGKTIEIGRYEKSPIVGEIYFCQVNDRYVAILTQNQAAGAIPTIKKLFDLKSRKFIMGEPEFLIHTFFGMTEIESPKQKALLIS